MSESTIERYEGMNQPPLTSANRPDLAALPAYVEPPPQITKVGRRKRSSFAILVMALGAGVCGGVALNEYKQHPPSADMPFQRFTEVPAEAPAPVVTRPEDVPLPEGVQPVHLGAAPPVRNQMVASRHPGSEHNRPQPARLTRPSNGYAGSL
jgi:hypothetical protein